MKKFKSFSMVSVIICLAVLGLSGCKDSGSPPEHPRGSLREWLTRDAIAAGHPQDDSEAGQTSQSLIAEFSQAIEDYVKETLKTTGTLPLLKMFRAKM